MRFQVFLSLWYVTSCLCTKKKKNFPLSWKNESLKTKLIFFIKVKTQPRPPKTALDGQRPMGKFGQYAGVIPLLFLEGHPGIFIDHREWNDPDLLPWGAHPHHEKGCQWATSALAGRAYSGGRTSGFSAAKYGCALGLPGQDARQWGSRSGCSFTQGPEERDRPGSTCHQSHRPSNRAFDVQPFSVKAPSLAHNDGGERGGQSFFPRQSGFIRQPVWTSYGGHYWMLQGGSEVVSGDATLPP